MLGTTSQRALWRVGLIWMLSLHTACSGCGGDDPQVSIVVQQDMGGEEDMGADMVAVDMRPQPAAVARVTLEPEALSLEQGDAGALVATVYDVEDNVLTGRLAQWSSSEASVVGVDNTGAVTARTPGTSTITISVEGVRATATVTVTERSVTSVRLEPGDVSLKPGAQQQYTATALDKDGMPLIGKPVMWTSSQPTVATVTPAGLVVGGEPGMTIIKADVLGISAQAVVTVDARAVARVEVVNPPIIVQLGQLKQAAARTFAEDNRELLDRPITWSVDDTSIAEVDALGQVTGKAIGTTTLTATSDGVDGTATIEVIPRPVGSILVRPDMTTINRGATTTLTATALDDDGNTLTGRTFAWSSRHPTIATVDASTGVVTGTGLGVATIEVESEGVREQATVRVLAPVASVEVSPDTESVIVGDEVLLNVSVKDDTGVPLARTVTWTSSDNSLAIVDVNGRVQTLGVGVVTITATSEGVSGTSTITISPVPVARITVTPQVHVLSVSGQVQLNVTAYDANDAVIMGRAVQWSSSATGVATVDAAGLVTGVARGVAYITATVEGKTATADIVIPKGFVQVQTGGNHSCGVTTDLVTHCWGRNTFGALGVGQTSGQLQRTSTPTPVTGALSFDRLSSRALHTCALNASDELYCWGWNNNGQLGSGDKFDATSPRRINTVATFVEIATGGAHSCGRTAAGTIYCWGDNTYGQIGDGTNDERTSPRQITGTYSALAAGGNHTCAIRTSDQHIVCWGRDNAGQLGKGDFANVNTPTPITSAETFVRVAAGSSHTCGLTTAGAAYCWGDGLDGQLGDGAQNPSATPVAVLGNHTFAEIALGQLHTCGLTTTGAAYCWGANNNGQLGIGTTLGATSPALVSGNHTFSHITLGTLHTCGLTTGQLGLCWGYNFDGQLGEGTRGDRNAPYPIVVP